MSDPSPQYLHPLIMAVTVNPPGEKKKSVQETPLCSVYPDKQDIILIFPKNLGLVYFGVKKNKSFLIFQIFEFNSLNKSLT